MGSRIEHTEARWYAVRTKFRSEKSVVKGLKTLSVEAYVPLLKRVKQYASKRKEYQVPLINCYVFVRVSVMDFKRIYHVQGLFDFVTIGGRLIAIPDQEMELMQRIVGERYELSSKQTEYSEGQEVEIIAGSLTGLKGILVKRSNKKEFIIKLDHVGIDLIMEVPVEMLRPSFKRAG